MGEPVFAPTTFSYEAVIDFASGDFSIDARAMAGCVTDDVPNGALPISAGQSLVKTVYAKDPTTELQQAYQVTVKKLNGAETSLQSLRVVGGQLDPSPFKPFETREYTVHLSLRQDLVTVAYVLRDEGQRLAFTADTLMPTPSPSMPTPSPTQQNTSNSTPAKRRLVELGQLTRTGELQHIERSKSFLLAVGQSRRVV